MIDELLARYDRLVDAIQEDQAVNGADLENILAQVYSIGQLYRNVEDGSDYEQQVKREAIAEIKRRVGLAMSGTQRETQARYLRTTLVEVFAAGQGTCCLVHLAEAASMDSYRKMLRAPTYGLWSNKIDLSTFYSQMLAALEVGLGGAFREGLKRCGFTMDDLTPEEMNVLPEFIGQQMNYVPPLADFIMANDKLNKGLYRLTQRRLAAWTGRWTQAFNLGQGIACGDRKVMWVMNPAKEHCFPAGTMVTMADGTKRAIENVHMGDSVLTIGGPYKVTRTFARSYVGEIVEITAEGVTIRCTPGHPFLTNRGWIEAKDLTCGYGEKLVRFTDKPIHVNCHHWEQCKMYEQTIYNLEVKGIESYIANGFVVHNCSSCLKLHGKVKRMSYWVEKGILPQVPGCDYLKCRGYQCGCVLTLTDEPQSKGPLPHLP